MGCRSSEVKILSPRPVKPVKNYVLSGFFLYSVLIRNNRHCVKFVSFGRRGTIRHFDQVRNIVRGIMRGESRKHFLQDRQQIDFAQTFADGEAVHESGEPPAGVLLVMEKSHQHGCMRTQQSRLRKRWQMLYSASRLTEETDSELVRWGVFPYNNPADQLEPIVQGLHTYDKAHVLVLAEQNLIPKQTATLLLSQLLEMEEIGVFKLRLETGEGLHSGEAYLQSKLGKEVSGYVHLGRSSPDLKGMAGRLAMRDRILALSEAVVGLRGILLELARSNQDTIMASYGRVFQREEATSLARKLLETLDPLGNVNQRLMELYQRVNTCPRYFIDNLGFDLHSDRLASLLGLEGRTEIVMNTDNVVEFLSSLCILNRCLGELARRLGHWQSQEVGMVDFADRYCVTSSIRPQKRNPAGVEFVVGTEGAVIGRLVSALAVLRGVGAEIYTTAILQLWPAHDQTISAVRVMAGMLSSLTLKKDRMRELALEEWGQAPYLAALIVRKERLPWRTAHQLVAAVVRHAVDEGKKPKDLTANLINEIAVRHIGKHIELGEEEVRNALSVSHLDIQKTSQLLDLTSRTLEEDRKQLAVRKEKLAASVRRLGEAINSVREHKSG